MGEQVTRELTEEEMVTLASITLPVHQWGIEQAELVDGRVIAIPMTMKDGDDIVYIRPFFVVEDAIEFANDILNAINGGPEVTPETTKEQ